MCLQPMKHYPSISPFSRSLHRDFQPLMQSKI